jgi:CRISPR/Cas system endoribonuclease Cas6 (RAMP superfamily)
LYDTHSLWFNRLQQCKSQHCIDQQFALRDDDLNFYTSLNQSLTQHFLKFEHGKIAQPAIHLQVHQLGKDKIKIEGMAYRNPNNSNDSQTISFGVYDTR